MRRSTLLAMGTAALLALTGCSSDVSGTASKGTSNQPTSSAPTSSAASGPSQSAQAEPQEACDVLSTEDVAQAYGVGGGVEAAQGEPKNSQGIDVRTCRYVHKGIIIAALQTGRGRSTDSADELLRQVKLGMASTGVDTTSEPVTGIGEGAEYLPKTSPKQRTMIAVQHSGDDVLLTITAVAAKPGFDDRKALSTLTKTALAAM